MRALALLLVLASSALAADAPVVTPIPTTVPVVLTEQQVVVAQALVALAALDGRTLTPAQVVQEAVDQYLAQVRAASLRARQQERKVNAALAPLHKVLDAEIDKAEKAQAKP